MKLKIRQLSLDALSRSRDWNTFATFLSEEGVTLSFSLSERSGEIRGLSFALNDFRISGSKLGLHGQFTYGNLCKQLGRMKSYQHFKQSFSLQHFPEIVVEKKTIFIPVIRYIRILKGNMLTGSSDMGGSQSANREYEVGQPSCSWSRIDDRIEEETTSYKFKM